MGHNQNSVLTKLMGSTKLMIDICSAIIGISLQYGVDFIIAGMRNISKSHPSQSKCIRNIVLVETSFELENIVTDIDMRRKYCISALASYWGNNKIKTLYRWANTMSIPYVNNINQINIEMEMFISKLGNITKLIKNHSQGHTITNNESEVTNDLKVFSIKRQMNSENSLAM